VPAAAPATAARGPVPGDDEPAPDGWRRGNPGPLRHRDHAVEVWTGSELVVWGGDPDGDSGAAYDPAADRWSTMAPVPNPDGPAPGEPAVWTGRLLISWGINADDADASDDTAPSDEPPPVHGGSYDPVANRWQTFATGPLSRRSYASAVWTGQEMLVWGGTNGETPLGDGAAYRPE